MIDKIISRWVNHMYICFNGAFTLSLFWAFLFHVILMIGILITSPILMWTPNRAIKKPTLLEDFCKLIDKRAKEAKV